MRVAGRLQKLTPWLVVAALSWASRPGPTLSPEAIGSGENVMAQQQPESPQRPGDQTYLTFPEWYLVFSPEELATYMEDRPLSRFPYFGHIGQFWRSYGVVRREISGRYPLNLGYHAMIMVIGTSTTIEYTLRGFYELTVGRLTELLTPGSGYQMTAEDQYAAKVARDYVDFINVDPWYKFDFFRSLKQLWTTVPKTGPGMVRKWERRFVLTSEYLFKGVYAQLIGMGTAASYTPAIHKTRVHIDQLPALPPSHGLEQIRDKGADGVEVYLPRYQAFTDASRMLAQAGANYLEIAGNTEDLILSILVEGDAKWQPPKRSEILFEQPILTHTTVRRVVLRCMVKNLADTLRALERDGVSIEHVFDY